MSARPPGTVVLMKGLEVAQLYPDVVSRPFHDVDLLVTDPQGLWDLHRERGYGTNPNRRADIDHHHLPPLIHPAGHVGLELHHRPNAPGWAPVRPEQVFATAEPSRTPFDGILRPRDDLHALLLALHGWKSGFGRLRDLFDARVLAVVSGRDIEATAAELGLRRLWQWTVRLSDGVLFGQPSRRSQLAARALLAKPEDRRRRRRVRVLAPYLVAGPVRVTRGHLADHRLGREARRRSPQEG